jgi:hypothetical protein
MVAFIAKTKLVFVPCPVIGFLTPDLPGPKYGQGDKPYKNIDNKSADVSHLYHSALNGPHSIMTLPDSNPLSKSSL